MANDTGRVLSVNVGGVLKFEVPRPSRRERDVGAGDEISVVERPDHDLTIRDVFRIYTRDRLWRG